MIKVLTINRLILPFFFLLISSCAFNKKKSVDNSDKVTFEETQDSLRNILLHTKPNKNIKASLLQELYIRGLVNDENDKIQFNLPFNLDGFDCGTPNCYATNISFEFIEKEPLEFPKTINFKLQVQGCDTENETPINGVFELVERSPNFVNYYASSQKSNLVILKKKRKLYYFSNVKPNTIKGNSIAKTLNEYNEEDVNGLEFYQSSVMTANDYSIFLTKK